MEKNEFKLQILQTISDAVFHLTGWFVVTKQDLCEFQGLHDPFNLFLYNNHCLLLSASEIDFQIHC